MGDALVGQFGQQPVQGDGSGVVRLSLAETAPSTPTVPKLTALSPSASHIWRVKLATEVLPLVPVTATITSGWSPNQRLAATESNRRGWSCNITGTCNGPPDTSITASPAGSVRIAAAPASSACAAKAAPCAALPGSATNRCPGRVARLSTERPVSSGSDPDQSPARRVPVSRPSVSKPVSLFVRSVPAMLTRVGRSSGIGYSFPARV